MAVIEILASLPHGLLLGVVAVMGAVIGSFIALVIHRLPQIMMNEWHDDVANFLSQNGIDTTKMTGITKDNSKHADTHPNLSLSYPSSHCPHCCSSIAYYDNIPIISYLILQGKCRHCQAVISPMYPLVELGCAVLSVWVVMVQGMTVAGLLSLLFVWFGVALAGIDWRVQLLPDRLVLPLGMIGLVANGFGLFTSSHDAIFGAVAGFVLLWAINAIYKILRGHDGMGLGDAKLLAALGAWLGVWQLPWLVLMASAFGVVAGVIDRYLSGKSRAFAFGPHLLIAGFILLLYGESLTDYYLKLFY
ncbi:prepilin peptidase [Moraxella marmotae]|uniref:prepilin peptidase n=1 Tax=Moraxella marmotae TaxID=3344520 RepID=UPI0035F41588